MFCAGAVPPPAAAVAPPPAAAVAPPPAAAVAPPPAASPPAAVPPEEDLTSILLDSLFTYISETGFFGFRHEYCFPEVPLPKKRKEPWNAEEQ